MGIEAKEIQEVYKKELFSGLANMEIKRALLSGILTGKKDDTDETKDMADFSSEINKKIGMTREELRKLGVAPTDIEIFEKGIDTWLELSSQEEGKTEEEKNKLWYNFNNKELPKITKFCGLTTTEEIKGFFRGLRETRVDILDKYSSQIRH